MLIETPSLEALTGHQAAVIVIGGGPLGLNTALALAGRGVRTLVLESGPRGREAAAQDAAADELLTPDTHYPPEITTARRLGGAGSLWGGRCLPCDPIDFQPRPWLDLPGWPIGPTDLDPWLGPACAAFAAGDPVFRETVPGLQTASEAFSTDTLERWSNQPRPDILHKDRIEGDPNLLVALGVTVCDLDLDASGRILALDLWMDGAAQRLDLADGAQVILAAGGNAATRLLLNVQATRPDLFGGPDGPLGRYYMGHVNGQIADIVFENEALHKAMDFHVDGHGSYVRRRIAPSPATQKAKALANVVFWPVVPEISQPEHRSGPLSAVFLALSTPGVGSRLIAEPIRLKHVGPPPYRRLPHLRNVLTDPLAVASFAPWFIWNRRYAKHRLPGFFLKNPGRRYGLEFHSEHLPNPDSRLMLSDARDRTGLRRLRIDFRFSDRDVQSVLDAHDALEDWLTAEGLARLIYRVPKDTRAEGVLAEARHGNHQEGTIRMGTNRSEAVVDGWGTAFDVANLHVVSTAILPTSSQANPTLTALQLGLRLADRLAGGRA
ncbi:MAG: GMC oxidoreductase [Qingshengfaniella sp.]